MSTSLSAAQNDSNSGGPNFSQGADDGNVRPLPGTFMTLNAATPSPSIDPRLITNDD